MTENEFSIEWTDEAIVDTGNIYADLCEYSSMNVADKVDLEIDKTIELLAHNPHMGLCKPKYDGRCLLVKNTCHFIFYSADMDLRLIRIVRILHQNKMNSY